jgi:hypothetical protein
VIRSRPLWKTAVLVVAASPTVQAQEVVEPTGESLLSGTLSLRHRERWTSFADDHDLFATLSLDYGDPSRDSATFHLPGRAAGGGR